MRDITTQKTKMSSSAKRARLDDAAASAVPVPVAVAAPATIEFASMTRADMLASLKRDGYVVVRGVASREQAAHLHDLLWRDLELLAPGLRRADKTTWTPKNRPEHAGGLIQHYGVGWWESCVRARALMSPVFATIWGVDVRDLWTSFDGVSITRKPAQGRCAFKDVEDWSARALRDNRLHVDQTVAGFKCVQGGLALCDQPIEGHVFVCVPGSHLVHTDLMARGPTKKTPGWETMTPAQLDFLEARGFQPVRVALSAGDAVYWDSRTVHNSGPYTAAAAADSERAQIFACMTPSPPSGPLRDTQMAKRRAYHADRRTSKHSPWPVRVFGKKPRSYGGGSGGPEMHPENVPRFELDADARKLHGLE